MNRSDKKSKTHYPGNCITLLRENNGLNKWKAIPHSWNEVLYIIKILIHYKIIYIVIKPN